MSGSILAVIARLI